MCIFIYSFLYKKKYFHSCRTLNLYKFYNTHIQKYLNVLIAIQDQKERFNLISKSCKTLSKLMMMIIYRHKNLYGIYTFNLIFGITRI